MATCFIMQPFDGDTFDKRCKDIFVPAICDAGLDPYRVDQDPKVSIPIQDIENGIRDSSICLAEITIDNPNVWFELGFAIACGREVVLGCSDERKARFPFDIQHRSIIRYATASSSDFEKLKSDITTKLKAYLQKTETLSNISEISKLTKFEGLEQHEVVTLAALAQNIDHPDDNASIFQIKRDMEASGFTKIATMLSLKNLTQQGFVEYGRYQDETGDYYSGYTLTEKGWDWVLENKDKFVIEKPELPF